MVTESQPWYAKGENIIWAAVAFVVFYFAFPYLRGVMPNERRDSTISLYNNYVKSKSDSVKFFRGLDTGNPNLSDQELLDVLRQMHSIVENINPYEPVGVDPGLASAVSKFKILQLENLRGIKLDIENGTFHRIDQAGLTRRDQFRERLAKVEEDIEKEFNRIAAEVGGMTRQKGEAK